MQKTIDATTTRRMAQGDEEAFRQIFDQYWDVIYHFVRKKTASPHDAEEVATQLFTQVWQQRTRFADIDYLKHFLAMESCSHVRRILKHRAIETMQKKNKTPGARIRHYIHRIYQWACAN